MAGTFNFNYEEKYPSRTCVVKYWFGTKYFIWKALHLHQSCDQVFRDLNNKIGKYKMGTLSELDLFYKVAKHCHTSRCIFATVEVLLMTDDLHELIAFDRDLLQKSIGDPKCLNISADQYLPGWLKTVTQNKALQSNKISSVTNPIAKRVDIKSEPKKQATEQKLAPVETTEFDTSKILKQIKAIKKASDGKS